MKRHIRMSFLFSGEIMILFSVLGSISIALAYMLLSLNFLKDKSKFFFYLLLIGNIAFATYSIYMKDYPVLMLNLGFAFFAITAILNIIIKLDFINFKIFVSAIILTVITSLYLHWNNSPFLNTLGWFSSITGFGIYLLYSQHKSSLFTYFFINMIVNITFSTYLYFNHNYPYMFLQLFVLCFSTYGVLRIIFEKKRLTKTFEK